MAGELLAVGWDAGGWRGDKQAVAVCRAGQGKVDWLGRQVRFKITGLQDKSGTLEALVRLAWSEAPRYGTATAPSSGITTHHGFQSSWMLNSKSR
jgi:hypothetical protein